MTWVRFLGKSVVHHWRMHLALLSGAALASALLTGALMVGDSMTASLRLLARERLGRFEAALVTPRPFRLGLAAEFMKAPSSADLLAAGVLTLPASARSVDAQGRRGPRVGRVHAIGVGDDFFGSGFGVEIIAPERGQVIVNQTLARELGVEPGDTILLGIAREAAAPLETFLGKHGEGVRTLRLELGSVLADRGPGLFSLEISQAVPRLAYLNRAELGRAVEASDSANTLLLAPGKGSSLGAPGELRDALFGSLALTDLGMRLRAVEELGYLSLESTRTVLPADTVKKARGIVRSLDLVDAPVLTHLAERIALRDGGKEVPYSTVAALEMPFDSAFVALELHDGSPAPRLQAGEILLNEWAARDLGIDDDDAPPTLDLDYYVSRPDETVATASASFRLRGIVRLRRGGADPRLTPEFPGLTEEKISRMRDWDVPFEIDFSRIDDRDEEYWERYRATPKAFVSPEDGRKYFATRFGPATSIRIASRVRDSDLKDISGRLTRALLADRELVESKGFVFRNVKTEALDATSGGSGKDFGLLFIGFSLFLIVSAAILVALFFGLGLDQRVRQIGILLAEGFSGPRVRRMLLGEEALVSGLGGLLGLLLALAYAAFLLEGLRTWWWGAVRVPFLVFSVSPVSLLSGFLGTQLVVFLSVYLMARRLRSRSVRGLLAGVPLSRETSSPGKRRPRKSLLTALVGGLLSVALAILSLVDDDFPLMAAFFGIGTCALIAGLGALSTWLFTGAVPTARGRRAPSLFALGMRNARRAPGRSLLTASLVATASFLIVAVGASHREPGGASGKKESGDGGFDLAASSAVPIYQDLASEAARRDLGLEDLEVEMDAGRDEPIDWSGLDVHAYRVRPGDDTSCLNLYAPRDPRLLGVSEATIARGGFLFSRHLPGSESENSNPWTLLGRRFDDGAVPVIGDANSFMYILKKGLGEDFTITDENGQELRLRVAGMLASSPFQGELLMAEERLIEHFPSVEGYRFFLMGLQSDRSAERLRRIERGLELGLDDHGFDAVETSSLIASYLAVEATYLSTFQLLGGLGLLLGTLGLGVALLRGVIERRGELALLQALGFPRRRLTWMVLAEDLCLLLGGMAVGTLAALLGLLVRFGEPGLEVPWMMLGLLWGLVLASGLLSGAFAVGVTLRTPMMSVLRSE